MDGGRSNLLNIFRRQGIRHAVPEFSLCPAMIDKVERRFGSRDYAGVFGLPIRNSGYSFLRQDFTDWQRKFFSDVKFLPSTNFDLWGVARESTPESMHMSRMYFPMRDFTELEQFRKYPYPEFAASQQEAAAREIRELHEKDIFVCGNMQCTVWETAWYMRGMEALMVDMMEESECAVYHLDRVTEISSRRAAAYAEAGADLVFLGDDIGMQHTIMMSEELYRRWLKPRLARVIAAARAKKPEVLICYHSCGYIEPFIEDLIEVGVDILNPVQPECMNFADIHRKYGSRLSFWGTLGTQTLFPHGTPEEVYRETIGNLRIAGAQGGLLAAPTHLVEPEVPLENIIAYVQACNDSTPGEPVPED